MAKVGILETPLESEILENPYNRQKNLKAETKTKYIISDMCQIYGPQGGSEGFSKNFV